MVYVSIREGVCCVFIYSYTFITIPSVWANAGSAGGGCSIVRYGTPASIACFTLWQISKITRFVQYSPYCFSSTSFATRNACLFRACLLTCLLSRLGYSSSQLHQSSDFPFPPSPVPATPSLP